MSTLRRRTSLIPTKTSAKTRPGSCLKTSSQRSPSPSGATSSTIRVAIASICCSMRRMLRGLSRLRDVAQLLMARIVHDDEGQDRLELREVVEKHPLGRREYLGVSRDLFDVLVADDRPEALRVLEP